MARTDRQPRKRMDPDARRSAILDAAAAAFVEQPYAEVTVTTIAGRADASDALLYRYFSGKEELYVAVVQLAIDDLAARQAEALGALPDGVPARDRIAAATAVYLDHIAHHPAAWATPLTSPGAEPEAAQRLRAQARRAYVERLAALLTPSGQRRHEYALWGYLGFLDAACGRWVEHGCPADERWALIDAALGALEGGLGDWAS